MATSYVFTPSNEQLIYNTLIDRLLKFAKETPDKAACVFYLANDTRIPLTCAELYQKSCLFGKGLVKMGIKPGDIVGIGLPNVVEWLVCHFGSIMAGAIPLALTFSKKDAKDVLHDIAVAQKCVALIFNPGENLNRLSIVKKFISGTNSFGKVQDQQIQSLEFAIYCGKERSSEFPFNVDDVLHLGEIDDVTLPDISPDDVCMIAPTSGSTGNPKLIPKTHFEMLNMGIAASDTCGSHQGDVIFNPSPFTWIGGYIGWFLSVGCTSVTVENYLELGTVETMAKTCINVIENEKCDRAVITPPCLYEMMNLNNYLGPTFPLKSVLVGGYPLHKSIAEAVGRVTETLIIGYGGTEFNGISLNVIDEKNKQSFTDYNCGPPISGVEVKVVDNDGEICLRNEKGTIHMRARWRFPGYLNKLEETEKVLTKSGWLSTDDMGYVTSDGDIISLGRQKEMINVRGAIISPYVVEEMIMRHPEVKSVTVVPIPDEKTYQQMCACIIRHTGSTVNWENIEDFLQGERVANKGIGGRSVMIPRYHLLLESFPITRTGKVLKNDLVTKAMELI